MSDNENQNEIDVDELLDNVEKQIAKNTQNEEAEETADTDDEFLKKTKKTIISTVITVVIAIIAIGAVIGVLVVNNGSMSSVLYTPSETEQEELKLAGQTLMQNNYQLIRMFYEEGLSVSQTITVDENALVSNSAGANEMQSYRVPTDNIYTVSDENFSSYSQVVDFVNATLTPSAAEDLLNNGQGSGAVYCEQDGVLCINMNNFQPISYDKNWSNISCEYKNITKDSADVFVTLSFSDTSDKAGQTLTLSGNLVKTDLGWRLEKIIY